MTREHLWAVARTWYIVAIAILVGGLVGGAVAFATPRTYESSASVYFSVADPTTATDLNQAGSFAQSQMTSFALLAKSDLILDEVRSQLALSETSNRLSGSIRATTPDQTTILTISADSASPRRAAEVANAVADVLVVKLPTVTPSTSKGAAKVVAQVVSRATAPRFASGPNTKLDVIAGLILGLLAGLGISLVKALYDTRIRDARSASLAGVSVLASIPRNPDLKAGDVATLLRPESSAANQFRFARSAIRSLGAGHSGLSFIVSATSAGQGSSTVAANLAAALSEADAKIVLVDANLYAPAVAGLFGHGDGPGLTDVLLDTATLPSATVATPRRNLDLVPAGSTTANGSALLASRTFSNAMESLKKKYDIVIVDAPAADFADATTIGRHFDGVVLVVAAGVPSADRLTQVAAEFSASGTTVLGAILNLAGVTPKQRKRKRKGTGAKERASVLSVSRKVEQPDDSAASESE